jgi:hypothetical protein
MSDDLLYVKVKELALTDQPSVRMTTRCRTAQPARLTPSDAGLNT